MSDSGSDRCCLSDACYCFHGNNTNTQTGRNWEAKEISNPLPLDYFFMSDEELKESNRNPKSVQKDGTGSFPRSNDITNKISRRQNNVSAPLRYGNSSEKELQMLQGMRNDTIYQEIFDGNDRELGKSKVKKKQLQMQNQGYLSPQMANHKPEKLTALSFEKTHRKINIKFITNRIIVGYLSETSGANHNLMMKSLSTTYGKQIKKFDLKVVNSADKLLKPAQSTGHILYSLVNLMPSFTELLELTGVLYKWLIGSRKHVIILVCESSRCELLLGVMLKFLLTADETNRRYLKKDSVILLEHEINSLKYFEQIYLERCCIPSLNRYVLHSTNLTLKTTQFSSTTKQLYAIIINYDAMSHRHHSKSLPAARLRGLNNKQPSCLDCGSNYGDGDLPATNCQLQNIYLTIYRNFSLIHTTYKINIAPNVQPDKLIYIIDPVLLLNGDILIFFNATNKMGFQTIFFRLQFHTCWLKGNYCSFKSSDLDKSYDNCHVESIANLELHFRNQQDLMIEHENAIISQNYSIVHPPRSTANSDLATQLQLLEHCLKAGHTLSYTAGPVDGNLYAAVTKTTPKNSPSKDENLLGKSEKSTQTQQINQVKKSPSIIHKFNNVEHEISTAADLINTSVSKAKVTSKPNLPQIDTTKALQNQITQEHVSMDNVKVGQFPRSTSYNVQRATNYVCLYNERDNRSPSNQPELYSDAITHPKITSSPYDNIDADVRLFHSKKSGTRDQEMQDSSHHTKTGRNTKFSRMNHQFEYDNFQVTHEDSRAVKLMNFIVQNESMWYKPHFSRQDAILYLMNLPIGSFLVRQSTSFVNSLTLAIKCSTSLVLSSSVPEPPDHVKHFILDYVSPAGGYVIRGLSTSGVHPTLPALIVHHLDPQNACQAGLPVPLALPPDSVPPTTKLTSGEFASGSFCVRTLSPNRRLHSAFDDERLILSDNDDEHIHPAPSSVTIINNVTVFHLGSYITRHRATQEAAKRSITLSVDRLQQKLLQHDHLNQSNAAINGITKMSLRLTNDRMILTDLNRKMFFRKHIKLIDILCCCVDPQRRVWNLPTTKTSVYKSAAIAPPCASPIFGIVSHITSSSSSNTNPNSRNLQNHQNPVVTDYSDQIYCQLFCTIDRNTDNFCAVINRAINTANVAHLT